MKLTQKLIPLGSIAVLSASIVPFSLTSCSTDAYIGKGFDLVNNFYPDIERFQPEERLYGIKEIHHLYVDQLDQDITTFIQDYMWSKSRKGFSFEQYLFWRQLIKDDFGPFLTPSNSADREVVGPAKDYYERDIETISSLSMTKETCSLGSWTGWIIPRLSFTLNFESYIDDVTIDLRPYLDDGHGYIDGTVSGEIAFHNVPFYCILRNVEVKEEGKKPIVYRVISFEPFYELMEAEGSDYWRIQTSVYSSLSGEITYSLGISQRVADDWRLNVLADNNTPDWKYGDLSLSETIGIVFTTSYYLDQIQPYDPPEGGK